MRPRKSGPPPRGRKPPLHPQDRNRLAAARLLHRIDAEGAYAQIVRGDDPADGAAKTREYVSGVTRWRRWLDYLIATYYTGEYEEMESELRQILRIGAYDLCILRTLPHVAVSAAVAVARDYVGVGGGHLANAVLRRLAETRDNPPSPTGEDEADELAIRWSHPTWMVRRWLPRFGREDTVRLLEANNARPWYGVRANPFAPDAGSVRDLIGDADLQIRQALLPDFVEIDRLGPVVQAGLLDSGRLSVQDVAAALAVRLLDPQPGETVIDACAAPGGKSTYAAALMNNRGQVIAVDRNKARLRLVRRASGRQGIRIIETLVGEFEEMVDGVLPRPDRVIVDAPCSGLGVLGRRPDLRWRKQEEDILPLQKVQLRLLARGARLLPPGGVLVYSTCTIAPEENEDVTRAFLDAHADFERENAAAWVQEEVVGELGQVETLPHKHGTDGAYAVRFRRRSG